MCQYSVNLWYPFSKQRQKQLNSIFCGMWWSDSVYQSERPKTAREPLKKKNKVREFPFKHPVLLKTIVIKAEWYWWSDRQVNKWSKITSPETISFMNANFVYSRVGIENQCKKESLLNKYWETWSSIWIIKWN